MAKSTWTLECTSYTKVWRFSCFGVPVKEHFNIFNIYDDILDMMNDLPALYQQFVFVAFLWTKPTPWRNSFGLEELTGQFRALTSTHSSIFEMNWSGDSEPGLISRHQCCTSLMLLLLDVSNKSSQITTPDTWNTETRRAEAVYSSRLILMVFEWRGHNVWVSTYLWPCSL